MAGEAMTLHEAWTGIMLAYTEQDFPPTGPEYERQIPGWQCTACDLKVGTAGPPPRRCRGCGQEWDGVTT